MAPLPKSKRSTARKGRSLVSKMRSFSKLVKCANCGKNKLPHRACKYCKK